MLFTRVLRLDAHIMFAHNMNRKPNIVLILTLVALSSCRHLAVAPNAQPVTAVEQPDYVAWQAVANGMPELKVLSILGEPVWKEGLNLGPNAGYYWNYGTVVPQSAIFPSAYEFRVWFIEGKVFQTEDPFDGHFSTNGLPTTPTLIYPQDGTVFSHYPRLVDLRWYPSSGHYPMKYKVEISVASEEETTVPFVTSTIGGANSVRWRVKAINKLGESLWSEYRSFEFTK